MLPPSNGYKVLFGDIDIIVHARNNVNGGNRSGVFQLDWSIIDEMTGEIRISSRPFSMFGAMNPTSGTLKTTYLAPPTADPNNGTETDWQNYYNVTNSGNQPAADVRFDSNVLENSWKTEDYPDSIYLVKVKSYPYPAGNPPEPVEAVRKVAVDNYRPYVEQVTVTEGAETIYDRRWTLSASEGKLFSLKPDTEEFLENGRSYDIQATFSEYMDEASVSGVVSDLDDNHTIHKSTLTTTLEITGYTADALRPLEFKGKDVAGNYILTISPDKPYITPALELTRDAQGNMQGASGSDMPDTFHTLRIEAAPPVLEYQGRDQILSNTCRGACGTDEKPINLVWNLVRFRYKDIGAGIQSVTIQKKTEAGLELVRTISYDRHIYEQDLELTLADGQYVATFTDYSGNPYKTVLHFRVDPDSPRLELLGLNMAGDFTNYTAYGVVRDTASGMDFLRLHNTDALIKEFTIADDGRAELGFTSPALAVGRENYYVFSAQDKAGNGSYPQPILQFDALQPGEVGPGQTNVVANYITEVYASGEPCTVNITSQRYNSPIPINYTLSQGDSITAALPAASMEPVLVATPDKFIHGNVSIEVPEQVCQVINGENVCRDACAVSLTGRSIIPLSNGPALSYTRNQSAPDNGVKFRFGWYEITFFDLAATADDKLIIENVGSQAKPDGYVAYPLGTTGALRIKYEGAEYTAIEFKACGMTGATAEMRVLHYKDNGESEQLPNLSEGDCVTARSTTNSIFSVIAPIGMFDKLGPRVDVEAEHLFADNGVLYVSSASPVGLKASDLSADMVNALAGVATTYYLLGIEPTPDCLGTTYEPTAAPGTCQNPVYGGQFAVREGLQNLYYRAVDKAGNMGDPWVTLLGVDGTAPQAEVRLNGAAIASGATIYATTADTFTLSAFDPESNGVMSGLATTYFLVDISTEDCAYGWETGGVNGMGSCENNFYTGPFSLPEGEHVIYYAPMDNAGNMEAEGQVFVRVLSTGTDSTPPVSSVTLSGTMGRNDWYVSPVGVSITAVDESTGVAGTYYSLDGSLFAPVPVRGAVQPPAGWAFGEVLRVTERSGAALNDYQFLAKVDTQELIAEGKMRADCGDLRVYSGDTALNYWLEKGCNTAGTRVWVKLPALAAGGAVDLTLVYGNPGAVSVSNGPGVFDFYDDFNDNTIDYTRWRTVSGQCGMSERNGRLEFYACSSGDTLTKPWMVPLNSMPQKYVIETDVYGLNYGGSNPQGQYVVVRWDGVLVGPNNPQEGYLFGTYTGGAPAGFADLWEVARDSGFEQIFRVYDTFTPETWHTVRITDDSSALLLHVDDGPVARYETVWRPGSMWALSARDYPSPSNVYYDNFRLRKYAAVEPLVERGAGSATLVVTAEGPHAVRFYSEDQNGNREAEKSVSFKIDRAAPVVSAAGSPAPNARGWNNSAVAVSFSGLDAVSGVEYCSPPALLAVEGSSLAVSGYCGDYAGHTATAAYYASIDTTLPVIGYTPPPADSEGWYNAATRLKFSCSDALSGVLFCGAGGTLDVEGTSVSTSARAEDNAGNVADLSLTGLKVDLTAPVSEALLSGVTGRAGAYLSTVTVSFSVAEQLSGFKHLYYTLDGSEPAQYTGSFLVGGEGAHTVAYLATDKAGNIETLRTKSFYIDSLPPVSRAAVTGEGANGWYSGDVTVLIEAADSGSGVEAVYYKVDSGSTSALNNGTQPPPGWSYAERLVVTERAGTPLAGYQLLLKLNTAELISAGKLRADCGDLRVYSDAAALPYWLDGGCNGPETRVWIRVPALAANGTASLKLAYGNPSAASAANGAAVFDFYDDFNDNAIDYTRWRTVMGDCPMAESNGRLEFAACSTGETLTKPWMVPLNSMPEKYVMEMDVYGLNYGGANPQAQYVVLRWDGVLVGPNNPQEGYLLGTYTGGSPAGFADLWAVARDYGFQRVDRVYNVFFPETWHRVGITDDLAGLTLSVDGAQVARFETLWRPGGMWALTARDYPSPSSVYYDNFRLRKYAAVEPVVTRGAPGGSVAVSGPGFHSVEYYSEDRAGNVEPVRRVLFNISGGSATVASPDGEAAITGAPAGITVSPVSAAAAPAAAVAAAVPELGVEPVSAFYEFEPSGVPFETPAKITFIFDPAGVDLATLGIYYFDGVAWTSAPVTGQVYGLLPDGRAYMEGYIAHTSLYAVMRAVDSRPPASAMNAEGVAGADGARFVTGAGVFSLASLDDLAAAGDGRGFGVRRQSVRISTGAQTLRELEFLNAGPGMGLYFVSTFTLAGFADGRYQVDHLAEDVRGHVEGLKTLNALVDNTAPETEISLAGAPGANGWLVSSVTVSLVSVDSGAGVAGINYQVEFLGEKSEPQVYVSPFGVLEEGHYKVYYQAADRLGNSEVGRTAAFGIDLSTPAVSVSVVPAANAAGWHNTAVQLVFSGTDTLSGVAECSSATVTAQGAGQFVAGWCSDAAGNTGYSGATLNIDLTPPVLNVGSPAAGQTYIASRGAIRPDFAAIDNLDPSPVVEAFLEQLEDRGSPRAARPVKIAVAPGQVIEPLDLDDGLWQLSVTAADAASNTSTAATGAFEIIHDVLAPRSTLEAAGPAYRPAGATYLTSAAVFKLSSMDDLVADRDGIGLGVKSQEVKLKAGGQTLRELSFQSGSPGPGAVFISTFSLAAQGVLPDGEYGLSYGAVDTLANAERSMDWSFVLDNTPPSTAFGVSGASHNAADVVFITRDTGITLAGVDVSSGGVASGLMLTKYKLDDGAWQVYAGSFTITAQGRHTLAYYSIDNVQNAEERHALNVTVDNAAPTASLSLGEPRYEAFGLQLITQATPVTLSAADAGADASGVKAMYYELTGADGWSSGVRPYLEPFSTGRQGTFLVRYWAVDNVGNLGAPKEERLRVSDLRADALDASGGLDMAGTADIAGTVRSNGVVALGGSARILGDVWASTITLSGKAQITGQAHNASATLTPVPLEMGDIVLIASATNSNALIPAKHLSGGKLVVSSKDTLTLSTGVYYFTGLELTGGARVFLAGKVDILVAGDVSIGGGAAFNAAGTSSGLNIFLSTASTLTFTGGGSLAAYVYAPYAQLKLAGNALLGGHYFVRTAALSGTGNIIQSGETLPQGVTAAGDGVGNKKVKAMAAGEGVYTVLAGPDPAFRLGEVYVFPNPAKGGAAPVFHVETGLADSVKITVYTVSGRQAHEHTLTGLPAALDDGNGLSYAYEYAWRGHIPSGVYYYHIEAVKAGQKLKKSGKFAVVR